MPHPAPDPMRRSLGRLSLGVVRSVAGTAVLALGLVALAVTAARPEALALGLVPAATAALAFVGTALPGLLPLLVLAVAFLIARRLSVRGESGAWEALGLGSVDAWLSLRSLWIVAMAGVLLVGFVAEPWAWSTLHRFRGTPAASAVGWARLSRGEALVLDGGGAAILDRAALRFSTADLQVQGALGRPRPEPAQVGWVFGPSHVSIATTDGPAPRGRWQAERIVIRLRPEQARRYSTPPENPRAHSLSRLLGGAGTGGRSDRDRRRARFVVHRRLALACGVPLLALGGWLLGWSVAPGGRSRGTRGLVLLVFVLALYGTTRAADHAALSATLPAVLAAWAPWLASLLALACLGVAARGPGR